MNKEEEDPEPLLKYQRIGKYARHIFAEDNASAIALHSTYIVIGTYTGAVHILSLNGKHLRRLHTHVKKVNDISIDKSGTFIATASNDGNIAINKYDNNLFSENQNPDKSPPSIYNFSSPVHSCQLLKTGGRVFASGGMAGQVLLNVTKSTGLILSSSSSERVIHEGEGPITSLKWNDTSVVAWANDFGVKLYDVIRNSRIAYVERPDSSIDFCTCQLVWEDTSRLIIGWGSVIRFVQMKKDEDSCYTSAEITCIIHTDFYISGISLPSSSSSLLNNSIIVLAFNPPGTTSTNSTNSTNSKRVEGEGGEADVLPSLHLIDRVSGEDIVPQDSIPLKKSRRTMMLRPSDLKFVSSNNNASVMYLCSPSDLIIIRPRDADDKVDSYLAQKDYHRAITVARNISSLKRHDMATLVDLYISELFTKRMFEKAAAECQDLLKTTAEWEKWIWSFAQHNMTLVIAPVVPTNLSLKVFDMILHHALDQNEKIFASLVTKWPKHAGLYNLLEWIQILESRNQNSLKETLAELYVGNENYEKALEVYISCRSSKVFKVIVEYSLWKEVDVIKLVEIDTESAIQLFVSYVEHISIKHVVKNLLTNTHNRRACYSYLHSLFLYQMTEYVTQDYVDEFKLQVELYLEFEDFSDSSNNLLTFVKVVSSSYLSLNEVYKMCKEKIKSTSTTGIYDVLVFVLSVMNRHFEALDLILLELRDIEQGISYVQEYENDAGVLWEHVIDVCLASENQLFISQLLEVACSFNKVLLLNPLLLVEKIPADVEIVNLKRMVLEILHNMKLQYEMTRECKSVFEKDCQNLLSSFVKASKKGIRVRNTHDNSINAICRICRKIMKTKRRQKISSSLILYGCGHLYHKECVVVVDNSSNSHKRCYVCNTIEEQPIRGIAESRLQEARAKLEATITHSSF